MKNFSRCIRIVGLASSLASCSSFANNNFTNPHGEEYLKAQSAPPIRLPAGIKSDTIREDYLVPNADVPAPTKPVSLIPPSSLAEQVKQGKVTTAAIKQQEAELNKMQPVNATTVTTTNPADINNGISGTFKNNTLMLNQTATSAWPVVEDAINKAGYKIVVKNANTQTFYILDIISSGGAITKTTPIYQIHLRPIPLGTQISVSDNNGNPAKLEDANRILDNIYTGLPKAQTRRTTGNSNPATQGVTPNANPSSNFGRIINSILH